MPKEVPAREILGVHSQVMQALSIHGNKATLASARLALLRAISNGLVYLMQPRLGPSPSESFSKVLAFQVFEQPPS